MIPTLCQVSLVINLNFRSNSNKMSKEIRKLISKAKSCWFSKMTTLLTNKIRIRIRWVNLESNSNKIWLMI